MGDSFKQAAEELRQRRKQEQLPLEDQIHRQAPALLIGPAYALTTKWCPSIAPQDGMRPGCCQRLFLREVILSKFRPQRLPSHLTTAAVAACIFRSTVLLSELRDDLSLWLVNGRCFLAQHCGVSYRVTAFNIGSTGLRSSSMALAIFSQAAGTLAAQAVIVSVLHAQRVQHA